MKKNLIIIIAIFLMFCIGFILFIKIATQPLSQSIHDQSAGFNGGFEVSESGYPVNWILYSPSIVKNGDFDIIIDTTDFKEGKQSLMFDVRQCSSTGGRLSPGFSNEIKGQSGTQYILKLWIKNIDSEYILKVGGVGPNSSRLETVAHSSDNTTGWEKISYNFTLGPQYKAIKLDLNIFKPGKFWIDGIQLEPTDTQNTKN